MHCFIAKSVNLKPSEYVCKHQIPVKINDFTVHSTTSQDTLADKPTQE